MMVYKAEASANQVNCYWICYVRTRICSRSFHLSHHCCKCSVQGGVKSVGLRICAIYSVSRMVKIPLFASSDFLALLVCLHVGWLLLVCCSCRPQINCSELLCTVDNSKRLAFCFYETIERKNSKIIKADIIELFVFVWGKWSMAARTGEYTMFLLVWLARPSHLNTRR